MANPQFLFPPRQGGAMPTSLDDEEFDPITGRRRPRAGQVNPMQPTRFTLGGLMGVPPTGNPLQPSGMQFTGGPSGQSLTGPSLLTRPEPQRPGNWAGAISMPRYDEPGMIPGGQTPAVPTAAPPSPPAMMQPGPAVAPPTGTAPAGFFAPRAADGQLLPSPAALATFSGLNAPNPGPMELAEINRPTGSRVAAMAQGSPYGGLAGSLSAAGASPQDEAAAMNRMAASGQLPRIGSMLPPGSDLAAGRIGFVPRSMQPGEQAVQDRLDQGTLAGPSAFRQAGQTAWAKSPSNPASNATDKWDADTKTAQDAMNAWKVAHPQGTSPGDPARQATNIQAADTAYANERNRQTTDSQRAQQRIAERQGRLQPYMRGVMAEGGLPKYGMAEGHLTMQPHGMQLDSSLPIAAGFPDRAERMAQISAMGQGAQARANPATIKALADLGRSISDPVMKQHLADAGLALSQGGGGLPTMPQTGNLGYAGYGGGSQLPTGMQPATNTGNVIPPVPGGEHIGPRRPATPATPLEAAPSPEIIAQQKAALEARNKEYETAADEEYARNVASGTLEAKIAGATLKPGMTPDQRKEVSRQAKLLANEKIAAAKARNKEVGGNRASWDRIM